MPDEVEPIHVWNTVHGDVHGDSVQIGYLAGDFTLHQHSTTRPPAELPLQIGVVPQRAASFQVRAGIIPAHAAVVLSGMGGVGKTQLAADFAQHRWANRDVRLLVWITASSRDAIVSGCAEVAAELTGRDDAEPERGAQRLLEWLARTEEPWLIVLDDLQDPVDLDGLWPPQNGSVLVTTRRRDAALRGHGRQVVEVGTFSESEGLTYLHDVLGGRPALLEGAADVVRALGCLPIALAQAGAYLVDGHLSCAEYLNRLWRQRPRKASTDAHQATVAATWSLSLRQAEMLRPRKVAGLLLDLASVLDPNGIPLDVLVGQSARNHLARHARCALDEADVQDVLAGLHRLSLITLDGREVRIHALVQHAHRDRWKTKQERRTVRAAADALMKAWPEADTEKADDRAKVLRANAESVITAGAVHLQGRRPHLLPVRHGHSLGTSGLVAEAALHFDRLHHAAVHSDGPYDFAALAALGSRARWRGKAGDLAGSLADYEHLFAHHHLVRRRDRADMLDLVLAARSECAFLRAHNGDITGGITELELLLAEHEASFGPGSEDALHIRTAIARYRARLAPSAWLTDLEELSAELIKTYGPGHYVTLAARHNLACTRLDAGDVARARAEFEQLVVEQTAAVGADHPTTLTTRYMLCHAHGIIGGGSRAMAEFERLLADQLRVLSPGHPEVQKTREAISLWSKQVR